jgi:ATP/maltotriose-dependent transcriptional regulator MalT
MLRRKICSGRFVAPREVRPSWLGLVRRSGPLLTEREVEILGLLATGQSNREMARRLFVSEATVKSHLSHIYTKLEVDTRAAAVARAIEQRIIRPPG